MGASNTPLPDLIELSGLGENTTYTATSGGGGDILGVIDTATYTDGDSTNSATQIGELNETASANGGTLHIGGVNYSFTLAVPDSSSDDVTVTYNGGASWMDLSGSGGSSNVVFIQASPIGGGATRYFMVVDDGIGDLSGITSIQTRDLDFTPAGDDVLIDLDQNQNIAPVCFMPGTLIETPTGAVPVEDLSVGDLVLTRDDGARPLRWIGRREMRFSPEDHRHKPVLIPAGSLGAGLPWRALKVSPQHRLLCSGAAVEALFDCDQVLVPAKGLTGLKRVRIMKGRKSALYIALLLDRHQIIIAEGSPTESFYPGPMALGLLNRQARAQVAAIFPRMIEDPDLFYGPPARKLLTLRDTKRLIRAQRRQIAGEMNDQTALPSRPGGRRPPASPALSGGRDAY